LQTGGGVNHVIVYNSFYGDAKATDANPAGSGAVDKCLQIGGTGMNVIGNAFNSCGQLMTADSA
jgi:hypothetical protein